MRVSFGDKSSVVAVRDSCTCGLLFCSMRFLLFAETPSSFGVPCPHGNHDKVLESVDNNELEEFHYFFRSCSLFPIWPFHAGDDEVLPISPTGTYLHHCFGILRDTNIPSWKQWLWICRLNRKAGKRTSILNVRANNFSMSFV